MRDRSKGRVFFSTAAVVALENCDAVYTLLAIEHSKKNVRPCEFENHPVGETSKSISIFSNSLLKIDNPSMLGSGVILLALASLCASTDICDNTQATDCLSVPRPDNQTFDQDTDWPKAVSVHQFHARDASGRDVSLRNYQGHVLVITNVASNCGLTDTNYRQLEELYEKYGASKGLRILAFPSNQFANQEPGNMEQILNFVRRYDVHFDIFEKIDVNGANAHPLWKWLKKHGSGFITDDIKWNFTKFVVDRNGRVVSRFSPTTEPLALEDTLNAQFEATQQ